MSCVSHALGRHLYFSLTATPIDTIEAVSHERKHWRPIFHRKAKKLTPTPVLVCIFQRGHHLNTDGTFSSRENLRVECSEVRFMAFLQAAALRLVEEQETTASELRRARARNDCCDDDNTTSGNNRRHEHEDQDGRGTADAVPDNFCGVIGRARGLRSDESNIFGT